MGPLAIVSTTPKGNLAAVLWKGKTLGAEEEIILFYQPQTSNTVSDFLSERIKDSDDSDDTAETKPFVLATASSKITWHGRSKKLAEPVHGHILHTFE